MGYPRHLLTDDETIVREFHPHWRVLIPATFWAIVGLAVIYVGWQVIDGGMWTTIGIGLGAAIILVLAIPPVIQRVYRLYVLTTERIVVRDGIIRRGGTEIPLENVNNVLFNQGVVERVLGYGDVLIESAGSQGQSRLTDIPDPEAFQSQLYRVREERSIQLKGSGGAGPTVDARDPVARLQALADLHDRGALSDAEFESQKHKLLDEM